MTTTVARVAARIVSRWRVIMDGRQVQCLVSNAVPLADQRQRRTIRMIGMIQDNPGLRESEEFQASADVVRYPFRGAGSECIRLF